MFARGVLLVCRCMSFLFVVVCCGCVSLFVVGCYLLLVVCWCFSMIVFFFFLFFLFSCVGSCCLLPAVCSVCLSAGSCCLSVFVVMVCNVMLLVGCWLLIGVCCLLMVLCCPLLCSVGV